MSSSIFRTVVHHVRFAPKKHVFSYPVVYFGIDLDELDAWARGGILTGYNRFAVFALHDADYLREGPETIREKVNGLLEAAGVVMQDTRIYLVTVPRFFGYVFNPVSFYLVLTTAGKLRALISEVNNTFGEKHVYLSGPGGTDAVEMPVTLRFNKEFFVSPFFDVSGEYEVRCDSYGETLSIGVALFRDGQKIFDSQLVGQGAPVTSRAVWGTLIRYHFNIMLTMLRIHWQAWFIYRRAGAAAYGKPLATNPRTVRSRQTRLHRLRLAVLSRLPRFHGKE